MTQLLEIELFQVLVNAQINALYHANPDGFRDALRDSNLGMMKAPVDLTSLQESAEDFWAGVEPGYFSIEGQDGLIRFDSNLGSNPLPAPGTEPAPLPQDRVSITLRSFSLDANDPSTLHRFALDENDASDGSAADGPANVDEPAAPPADPDPTEANMPAAAGQGGNPSEGGMAPSWIASDLVPLPPPAAPPPFTADAYLFDMMNDSDASAAAQTVSNSIFATDWQGSGGFTVVQADMSDPSWSIWGVDATGPYSGTGGWF